MTAKTNNYVINCDRQLIDVLDGSPKTDGARYTRLQAFKYLLDNLAVAPMEVKFCGKDFIIDQGQLVTSQTRLSKVWKWHHSVVTKFLNELIENGYLKAVIIGNATILSMSVSVVEEDTDDEESADGASALKRIIDELMSDMPDEDTINELLNEINEELLEEEVEITGKDKADTSCSQWTDDEDEDFRKDRIRMMCLIAEIQHLFDKDTRLLDMYIDITNLL